MMNQKTLIQLALTKMNLQQVPSELTKDGEAYINWEWTKLQQEVNRGSYDKLRG